VLAALRLPGAELGFPLVPAMALAPQAAVTSVLPLAERRLSTALDGERLTLDHVLADPRIGVAWVTTVAVRGSDRRALATELVLPG